MSEGTYLKATMTFLSTDKVMLNEFLIYLQ